MKMIEANKLMDNLMHLRKTGNMPGVSTGFETLDPYYTVRKGSTTIISGRPTSGKTQFTIQLLVNLTSLHGWKHAIYTPETGSATDIYAEIIHCLTGYTFKQGFNNWIPEKVLYNVTAYVSDYFKVIEEEEGKNSLKDWFEEAEFIHKAHDISTATIDNWNDIEHDMIPQGNKISEYLKFQLPRFNKFCKKQNIHGFLLAHPRNPIAGETVKDTPTPDQIEGGSLWYAKAQNMIIIHRDWSKEDFTTEVNIVKVKPKIVGKKGAITLQFAPEWNCYFEDMGGHYKYPETSFKKYGKPVL